VPELVKSGYEAIELLKPYDELFAQMTLDARHFAGELMAAGVEPAIMYEDERDRFVLTDRNGLSTFPVGVYVLDMTTKFGGEASLDRNCFEASERWRDRPRVARQVADHASSMDIINGLQSQPRPEHRAIGITARAGALAIVTQHSHGPLVKLGNYRNNVSPVWAKWRVAVREDPSYYLDVTTAEDPCKLALAKQQWLTTLAEMREQYMSRG
jgi:hypothetical protein